MKKFLLVGITLLLTTLSCGEDRDDENTQQTTLSQKIVGNWTITKKETPSVRMVFSFWNAAGWLELAASTCAQCVKSSAMRAPRAGICL